MALEATFGAGGTYATLAAACTAVIPANPNVDIELLLITVFKAVPTVVTVHYRLISNIMSNIP